MSDKPDHSIARVTEVIATSTTSFEDAISCAVERATRTLRGVKGAWVKEMKLDITNGQVSTYSVDLLITFVMDD
ncbi:MAG: dodecin protein [Moraxellaceae bacterium]|jgi:flavin-binding protein dodecin|nr:dodecin protein [Moraxellaceae bacterium]